MKSFFRAANLNRFEGQTVQPRQFLRMQQQRPRKPAAMDEKVQGSIVQKVLELNK